MSTSGEQSEEHSSGEEPSPRKGFLKWFKPTEKRKMRLVRTVSMQTSDPSLLRLRVPYEPLSLGMKKAALERWSGLALLPCEAGAHGRNFLICGMNALRAETLDMISMVHAMNEHKKVLTHAAVERFFVWLPVFVVYVERYFFVEEDVVLTAIEERVGRAPRDMRTGNRMQLRGRLQKAIGDMVGVQRVFMRSLPAGEKIGKLVDVAERVVELCVQYSSKFVETLTPLVSESFSRAEIDRLRTRFIKYVVGHVGADDLLVLYTRWMHPRELARWKTRALMPAEFMYRSYAKWERNVMYGHFIIPAKFTDVLLEETADDGDQAEKWREEMRRAFSSRARLEAMEYGGDCGDAELEEDCSDAEGNANGDSRGVESDNEGERNESVMDGCNAGGDDVVLTQA